MPYKEMVYNNKGDTVKCRVCGKYIKYNEPRLETHVAGYRKYVHIAIHIHHLNKEELDEIMVDEL